jgi:hypothetical protein
MGAGEAIAVAFLLCVIVLVIRGARGGSAGDGTSDAGTGVNWDHADPPGDGSSGGD